ncbi:AAA family ATPase [Rhodoferax sediminis]|uniref:AAA family ATPase n=1 Tax=Rhodoferax sediminis TaxID=2509614 RepID=A0A515D7Y1_9BURK|nr:AAA family ATPase [Rhodoferax sediminis]QDL36467.1 AAA family ATPase [Rhodoferax sediminis]
MIRDRQQQDAPPPGYRLHARYLGFKAKGTGLAPEILLDERLATQLGEEANRLREQEIAERAEREEAEERARDAKYEATQANAFARSRKKDDIDFDFDKELEQAIDPVLGVDYDVRAQHPVYPAARLVHWIQGCLTSTPDKEWYQRDHKLYLKLKQRGPLRRVAAPEDPVAALAALRESQPHFGAVIDLVAAQLALGDKSGRAFSLPPILLVGEPGVGKTHFAFKLADALGTEVRRQAFDNDQTGAVLLGSDRKWGNTTYGVVFDQVVLGQVANPIIVLDEVDKARRDFAVQDPLASLLTLLEPVTSNCVRDISTNFEFDASQIIWIATANDARRISAPLRSRFREFHIAMPTPEQALQMAPGIVKSVIESLALEGFEPPAREIVVRVAHLSPREIRQAIEPAVGHALANGRSHLRISDLPKELQDDAAGAAGRPQLH